MDGMDMGHSSSSSSSSSPSSSSSGHMMMGMSMGTFHWSSTGDALWFDAWMPKSESGYIGACFGLLFFAIASRGILALESYFVSWASKRFDRIHGLDDDEASSPGTHSNSSRANDNIEVAPKSMSSTSISFNNNNSNSSSNNNIYGSYPKSLSFPRVPPFSWPVDTTRSFLTAFATFLNYLLMLVVMTGNGGFFIVVIVGVFVGEMLFGRYRSLGGPRADHDH